MSLVKPTHKDVKAYYDVLQRYSDQNVAHEGAVRSAFQNLLYETGRRAGWSLVPELPLKVKSRTITPDGTFRDDFYRHRGFWEAKDSNDDLPAEIRKKIDKGYPLGNTIFEDTRSGHLFQNGEAALRVDLTDPQQLCDLLNAFFGYTEPALEDFDKAIAEFQDRVPDLARGLVEKIEHAHQHNREFIDAFDAFFELCKASLNPNLRREAVDEMLVQHLLTERLIRRIFDQPDFVRRNVIAAEVEKVIDALTSQTFSRHDFLKSLDRFYIAIEESARTIQSFSEKQHFLNTVYERFFQGYSVKVADTHGIVYTPQEIVDFMCASVVDVLEREFGKKLGDRDVFVLDPCTGTGNFIVNLLGLVGKKQLPLFYQNQLFANEVMLLPYYIASLNIEHEYYALTGDYEPFGGMCLVDSLDLIDDPRKAKRFMLMTEENTKRVEREKQSPITVILGNPPYNMGQQNENDNNKNRKYPVIDERIRNTYVKDSNATLLTKVYDAYVRFFRWASDRLGKRDGIVCMITNNGFLRGIAFEGFRKHILKDYDTFYHFDFKGNARTSGERRRREGGNIFDDQIRTAVGISLLLRKQSSDRPQLFYHAVEDYWGGRQKRSYLASFPNVSSVPWKKLKANSSGDWFSDGSDNDFGRFILLGSKASRAHQPGAEKTLFATYSPGVNTARDSTVYSFSREDLEKKMEEFCEAFNSEVDRYKRAGQPADLDSFLDYSKLKWSRNLKRAVTQQRYLEFDKSHVRRALYRPYGARYVYFADIAIDELGKLPKMFPHIEAEAENVVIACPGIGSTKTFSTLACNRIADFHLTGDTQCFPLYIYDEDGTNRRENVADWALERFRQEYKSRRLQKMDIFHYVYAMLHHTEYRERYADNLKRELPRIPLARDFKAFRNVGRDLAELHLRYEEIRPWELELVETPRVPLSYRVEGMKLSSDRGALRINESLSVTGIPSEAFEYQLGNRSALEWVIDQHKVKTDARSGIVSDPNCRDDPEYIVRLVGQVVRVSLETTRLVQSLPTKFAAET